MTGDAAVVAHLRARVHDALTELNGLRCTDPAASAAVHVVKLTEQTLEHWWIPTLDAAAHR